MSIAGSMMFGLAWLVMLGGVGYYIVYGSRGDLNPLKAFVFIMSFVSIGALLMVIGMAVS